MTRRFLIYRALSGFTCQAPVFALYGLSRGLHYGDLMTLVLAFAGAKIAFDLPSGVFADRVGRRAALLVRVVLEAVSVLLLLQDRFVASSLLAGAAFAFASGAESALVYEWNPKEYARVYGRAAAWGSVSTALAALVGGALLLVDPRLVYVLRFSVLLAAGAVAWTFVEPARGPVSPIREAARSLRPGFVKVLGFAGLVGAVQVAALQFQQPYLLESGVPLAAFGAVYLLFQLATAAGARSAHLLRSPLPVVAAISVAGFALLALPVGSGAVAALLLLKLAHGLALPTIGRLLNDGAPPSARASALSLRSLVEGAALLAVAPLLGWTADSASLHAAFGLSAVLVLPGLFFTGAPCADSGGSRASA